VDRVGSTKEATLFILQAITVVGFAKLITVLFLLQQSILIRIEICINSNLELWRLGGIM
jgi:hypothetical protein